MSNFMSNIIIFNLINQITVFIFYYLEFDYYYFIIASAKRYPCLLIQSLLLLS